MLASSPAGFGWVTFYMHIFCLLDFFCKSHCYNSCSKLSRNFSSSHLFKCFSYQTIKSPFQNGIILSQRLKNALFMIPLVLCEFKARKNYFLTSFSVTSNPCPNTSLDAYVHHTNCLFDPYIQWT